MRRIFIEGPTKYGESPRAAVSRMMAELDTVAASQGHRVTGDVTIMEYAKSPLEIVQNLRLEADVQPSV